MAMSAMTATTAIVGSERANRLGIGAHSFGWRAYSTAPAWSAQTSAHSVLSHGEHGISSHGGHGDHGDRKVDPPCSSCSPWPIFVFSVFSVFSVALPLCSPWPSVRDAR